MNQIAKLEQSLISLLKTAMPLLPIVSLPSGDDALMMSKAPRGGFYVQYQGSRFQNPNGLGAQNQIRDVRLSVVLIFSDAIAHDTAYDLLDTARQTLQGANVGTLYPLAIEEERFVDAQNGYWKYALSVSTSLMAFMSEPKADPLITQLPTITGL